MYTRSDAAVSHLLFASCLCSAWVYDIENVECFEGIQLNRVQYIKPSMDGTVKAAAFWTTGGDVLHSEKELIISIRGSARKIDHIVNLNDAHRDANSFLVSHARHFLKYWNKLY